MLTSQQGGLATSWPWLLQEAGGLLSLDVAIPPEPGELLPVLPYSVQGIWDSSTGTYSILTWCLWAAS